MGVHDVRVVCALLFNGVSQKVMKKSWESSKSILFEKETVSTKWVRIPPESLQNGCAHPHGPFFHLNFIIFFLVRLKKGQPFVTLMIVTFDYVL